MDFCPSVCCKLLLYVLYSLFFSFWFQDWNAISCWSWFICIQCMWKRSFLNVSHTGTWTQFFVPQSVKTKKLDKKLLKIKFGMDRCRFSTYCNHDFFSRIGTFKDRIWIEVFDSFFNNAFRFQQACKTWESRGQRNAFLSVQVIC